MTSLQTQDCVLLWSEDVVLWLNSVDWRGSNFYNLHISVEGHNADAGMGMTCGAGHPRSSPTAAVFVIVGLNRRMWVGQSTDQTMCHCVMYYMYWTAQSRGRRRCLVIDRLSVWAF